MIRVTVLTNDKDNKFFELVDVSRLATLESVCADINRDGAYSIRTDDKGQKYRTWYPIESIYRVMEIVDAGPTKQQ
jgi:hypothetical protein